MQADPMLKCLARCREPYLHPPSPLVTLEGHFNNGDSPDSSPSGTGFGARLDWAPRLQRQAVRQCLLPTHPGALAPHQPTPYKATVMLLFPQLMPLSPPESQKGPV